MGGNKFEEVLGLLVSGTEITRQANRVARGLVSVQSRFNQVVDESSSTGKALTEWYEEHNIAIYDQQGQLLSLYDVLGQVAEIWPNLTKNEQAYYLNQQAGANQTQNLAAILSNFDNALKATETALNSAGSAARENDRYMDSLNAHISALQSSFQQLSASVIDSDLAKSLLDIANAFLKLLNTPIGTFVTQVALLGSVLWGGSGLISAMKLVPNLLNKAGTAFTLLGTTIKVTTPQIYLIAAAIVAVISAVQGIASAWREAHPTFEMIQEDISELNSELETNKSRLEELENISWADRTTAQQAELDRIKEENEELEKQIELKKQDLAISWGEQTTYATRYVFGGTTASGLTPANLLGNVEGHEQDTGIYKSAEEAEKALEAVAEKYDTVSEAVENGTVRVVEYAEEVTKTAYAQQVLNDYLTLYEKIQKGVATSEEIQRFNTLKNELRDVYAEVDALNTGTSLQAAGLQEWYDEATPVLKQLNEETRLAELLSEGLELSTEQVAALKKANPELAKSIVEVNDAYYLETDAILECAGASTEFKKQVLQDNIERAQDTIEKVEEEIQALNLLKLAYVSAEGVGVYTIDPEANEQRKEWAAQIAQLKDNILEWQTALDSLSTSGVEDIDNVTEAEKTLTDVLKEQLDLLDHQAKMLERQGASSEEIIAIYKKAQQEIHETAEEYRRQGYADTSEQIRELEDLWWDYADSIKDIQEEILEEQERLWEENLKNQIDDLQSQADAWENAFQVVADKAQEEIDALEEQKDAVEEYYDNRIQALQDQNDELERQIQLEQAAMNLAQAESQQMLVYKDGRFQYVQNAQAISDAQVELERLEREEALRQEVANLEELKNQAVASIDAQIEYWEKYKEEWASVVSDYQEQQDILLAEQLLGIELEGENWEVRLGNLQSYVNEYISILSQLSAAQAALEMGFQGGGISLGGFGAGSGGGGSNGGSGYSGSYLELPGLGTMAATVVNGKLQQTNLPVGTILNNPNGQRWQITGGSGTDDDPYTSVLISGGSSSSSSSGNRRPSSSSGSAGNFHDKVSSANDTLLSGGHVGNVYIKGNARGTLGSEGGIRLVGENGPELRVLNQGDGIIPSEATKNLMEWGKISPKESVTSKVFQFFFDKLVLPNVTDLMSLQKELKNFNQFSFQH